MPSDGFPLLQPGQRAAIVGRNGTGKSWLARWLAQRSRGPWVVINPKSTETFATFGRRVTSADPGPILQMIGRGENVNWVPPVRLATASVMDAMVGDLCDHARNFGIVIDEAYTLHNHAQAGSGLTGLLTRGRELRQSAIICTQRPAWVSRFVFSESNYIAAMDLSLEVDRKTLAEATGNELFYERVRARHAWLWYDVAEDRTEAYEPVPLTNLK